MSRTAAVACLILAFGLVSCSGAGRTPLWLRIVCAVERMVSSRDMSVESHDRCARAERELEERREQLGRALRDSLPPEDESETRNPTEAPPDPDPPADGAGDER